MNTAYNSNVHYIEDPEGFGEWMGLDINGCEHYGATAAICRARISDANRVIAKHRRANPADVATIEKILADTQGRRGSRPNPVYFLDAGDLCCIGK